MAVVRERHEQLAVIRWLAFRGMSCFSVPNEGKRSVRAANYLKEQGLRPGAPDLVMIQLAPMNSRPTAIEMKSTSGKVTPKQKAMHDALREAGWNVVVGKGAMDAISQLESLGY